MNSTSNAAGEATTLRYSASSLQDYSDCPRRFKLRYLDQLVWPAVEAEPISEAETRQQEALLFHRMVQQHLLGVPAARLSMMASSGNLRRWWQNYIHARLDLDGCSLHAEQTLAARIGGIRLIATYDLIAVRSGKAVIYEWKTYARRPGTEWLAARWQARVYRAMLVSAGAELNGGRPLVAGDISMVYWLAEFPGKPVIFPYDERLFGRDEAALQELVQQILQASDFPLAEDRARCRFCVYRSLCDRGREPGAWRDGETDVAEEELLAPDSGGTEEMEF